MLLSLTKKILVKEWRIILGVRMMNDPKYNASKFISTKESEIDKNIDQLNNTLWCKRIDTYTSIDVHEGTELNVFYKGNKIAK